MPWTLREHGALTPELLAPVVLLGAALLAASPRTAAAAGALAAVAPFIKWPYALPLIAIVLFSAAPKKAILGAAVAIAVQAVGFTLLFGFGLWDDSVIAQMSSGRRGLDILKGVWGQAFWSLLGLVALAAVAWWRRAEIRDAPLLKVLLALGVGDARHRLTNYKDGTGLNVLVPVEYALVPLALAGAVFVPGRWFGVAALVFVLAQSASLLLSPNTNTPFLYPSSERGAWGAPAPRPTSSARWPRPRRARPASPIGGPPFLAFLAERPMPDDQPDQFLPSRSTRLADVQRRDGRRAAQVRLR